MNKGTFLISSHHGDSGDLGINLRLPKFRRFHSNRVLAPESSYDIDVDMELNVQSNNDVDLKDNVDKPTSTNEDSLEQSNNSTEDIQETPSRTTVFHEAFLLLKAIANHDGDEDRIQDTRKSVESRISSILHDLYEATETQAQDESDDEKSHITIMLVAANRVLNFILDELQQGMAEFHQQAEFFILVQMVHQEYTRYIISIKIASICTTQLQEMKPGDVGNLISWMNYCSERWRQTHPVLSVMMTTQESNTTQANLQHTLLEEYLVRGVHKPAQEMLHNIVASVSSTSESDIVQDENGLLATYQPLDIEFMMNGQLTVAKNVLPQKYESHVLAACNDELRAMIGNIMLDIESNWKTMAVARLCSVINDAARLSDQCEGHNEEVLVEDYASEDHIQAGHDLCTEFIELSLHATKYLCERIFQDLREPEPILTRIGDTEWEEAEREGSIMVSRTIATLVDYFEDLEEWIPHYYFAKCLKHSFDLTLEMYIDSFFSNTMAHGLKGAKSASSVLQYDLMAMVTFFVSDLDDFHGKAGFYSGQVIETRLEILSSLSRLLDSDLSPQELQDDIKTLFQQLGMEAGVPAVLHLAGLRSNFVNVAESTEWHVQVSRVTQGVKEEESSKDADSFQDHYTYKIPDLRNSVYLQKVKPVHDKNDSTMDATNRLVQRPGLSRNWSWRGSFRAPHTNIKNPDGPLISQQSRRNLLTQHSERNVVKNQNNNWRGPAGLSRLRSTRFNLRGKSRRNLVDDSINEDDDGNDISDSVSNLDIGTTLEDETSTTDTSDDPIDKDTPEPQETIVEF